MEDNKRFEIVLHKIPTWVSTALLVFTLSFFGYLIWTNNNLSNRILALENQQIHNKPFQITKFEKDSLVLELNKYQQKEDYFTTALEVQAAHYEHITNWGITISAFLLAMVGLIGIGWFWSSYDKLKKQIKDLEETIQNDFEKEKNKIGKEFKDIKNVILTLSLSYYSDIANDAFIKEKYHNAYIFNLVGLSALEMMNESGIYNERIKHYLNVSLIYMNLVKIEAKDKELFSSAYSGLKDIIKKLANTNNKEIENIALIVLAKHQEISNKLESLENNIAQ